jgi:molybdate transport system permease protein
VSGEVRPTPPGPVGDAAARRAHPPAPLVAASLVLIALLGLPTAVLLWRAAQPEVVGTLLAPAAAEALRLSLVTTGLAMGLTVLLGTPLAYLLARYRFRGRRLLDTLVDLPVVLPPVVAGVALLLVFGRNGVIGGPLDALGVPLAFTTAAVVLAQTFVASPFFVRTLKVGLAAVPRELEAAALTDGANRWQAFWRVTLPLSSGAFLEGLVLAWARALGEFGATIVFAGSLAGRTRTLPLAIYAALERDLDAAVALAGILTVAALGLFLVFRWLARGHAPEAAA